MAQPRIGIIIGSAREGGFGDKPAAWIRSIASRRDDLRFEMIDLRDHPVPIFAEPMSPAWAPKLADLDGFIIVAPEYNHGPRAVLKQALKHADAEFVRKPLAFIGYGGVGAESASGLLDELAWWTRTLKSARATTAR